MTPLQNFVIISPIHKEASSKIIIAEHADLPPSNTGKVTALGEKVSIPIKVGDIVMFKAHLFDPIEPENKNTQIIGREEGIIAKL